MESIQKDRILLECEDCGWKGTLAECLRTYKVDGLSCVEAIDFCPKCDGQNLMDIEGDLVPV